MRVSFTCGLAAMMLLAGCAGGKPPNRDARNGTGVLVENPPTVISPAPPGDPDGDPFHCETEDNVTQCHRR